MAIYFFDKNQTLIKIVPESATFEAIQTQELDDDSLLKDTLSITVKGDEKLLNAEYMAVKSYTGNAQTFDMYRIVTDTTPDKSMTFTGMSLAPYELNGHIIQDLRPTNQTLEYTLNRVLIGTDWRLGYIDDGLSNVTTNFYYVSVKEALKELQSLAGCEFVFKVEISGQKITDKWVEVYREMGNRTKKRFNYGTNALTVVRETNKTDIYTALIGRGKGEEVSSSDDNESGQAGYGRKITFDEIEWSTAGGNPLNKPKGQYYLEMPQATLEYGMRNVDGTLSPRIGIVEFDDEEDPSNLLRLTYEQLKVSARPKVLFKSTVANIGATGIGDTVTIHRHDLNMHYETRVRKVVRNKLNDNKTQIELGDAVVTPSTKRAKQNNATIKNLKQELDRAQQEITETRLSADGKTNNHYGQTEPERKRTGDTWYRPHPSIAGEYQVLTWDGNAWELILDTSDTSKVERELEEVIKPQIENMTISIAEADNNSKKALDKANVNTDLLGEHRNILASLNGQLAEDLVTDQTVTNPKQWLTNYGKLVANNGYNTTDYLPVNEGDLLSLGATETHYYKVAFYDKAKNSLGYYDGNKVVLTPNGTAYFGNTAVFKAPASGYVRLSYSTATGGADTVKLTNQSNLYALINSGYNNALKALINANIAMQEFGENLVSLNTLNNGYWLNANGALMENSSYKTSDYIRVDSGETYQLKGGYAVYQLYFYDENNIAIAYYDGKSVKTDVGSGLKYFTATPNTEIVIPNNASHVRIASSISDFSKIEFRKISTIIADTQKAIDFIKNEMLPQVSKDIENMRNDLSTVSDTAQSSLNIIGIDRGSFYSKNRRLGAKSQTIQKGDTAEILHNGDGFEVGKVYTLSFKAECIIGDIIEWVERTRTETIPFERVVQYSDTLRPDESYVQTAGVNGQATYAWQVETVNGVETGKKTSEIRTAYTPPVNEIYIQGTKTTSTVNFTIRRKLQDLSEARIVQIGDSITMGYGRDIKIPDVVKSELGAQSVQNAGYGSTTASLHPTKPELRKIGFTKLVDSIVSGNWTEALNADLSSITYATPQTYKNSLTALSNTDFSNIDAVIIMYGTNDWAMDVKLDNSSDAYDQNTYLGALRYGINKLQQAYPHLKILVAQPILWTMGSMTSESYNNGISLKVRDYANALNNSLNMDVPVAQIYNKGITTSNYTNYFNNGDSTDGTHPNSAGNAVIGQLLASEFERLIDIDPAPKTGSTVNFEIKKPSTVNFNIEKGG